MSQDRISVAVVGLGFGQDFLPIYLSHPNVERVAIVDSDAERLRNCAERYGITDIYATLDEMLSSDRYDAVHLLTPVAHHARQSVQVLESGRHCACAVPMATSIEDLWRIIRACTAAKRNYMMMETAVFSREYLYMKALRDNGELGSLTFLQGAHMQDLDGYPYYWMGYPPMTYSTHALSPLLDLAGARVEKAHCLGSGWLTTERRGDYDNPYPLETAIFKLDRDELVAQITMSFFQVSRAYQEGFSVYGDRMSVEWPQAETGEVQVHRIEPLESGWRGRPVDVQTVEPPDRGDLLPAEIAHFTLPSVFEPANGLAAVNVNAAHGGSHPHLVHEFVRSIIEDRPPLVDAVRAATWTAPGICGHESAMQGGAEVAVPRFE